LPLLTEIIQEPCLSIYVWQLDSSEKLDALAESSSDKKLLNDIHVEWKKNQFVASRHLLYKFLNAGEISYNANGKPYAENLFISNSHSHEYVAVIGSKSHPVGIDIQKYDGKVERIKSKFLHEKESVFEQNIAWLTMAWSLKESVYKINGSPSVFFKEHIRLRTINQVGSKEFFVEVDILLEEYKSTYVMKAYLEKDYCLAFGPVFQK
jgi:4'-phosphopantetheinyl transferase